MKYSYIILNTDKILGISGKFHDITNRALYLMREKLLEREMNPGDYIFPALSSEGSIPFSRVSQYVTL